MPDTKSAIMRFRAIDSALKNGPATTNVLISKIQRVVGKKVSGKTITNDLNDLKEGKILGKKAPISFSKKTNEYSYTAPFDLFTTLQLSQEELHSLELIAASLEIYQSHGIFQKFSNAISKVVEAVQVKVKFEAGKNLKAIIHTDDPPYSKGTDLLPTIVEAIEAESKIQFNYGKFGEGEKSMRKISPFFVKEYKGRWYVVGKENKSGLKTFGMDRISDLVLTSDKFILDKNFNPDLYYQNSFGVTVVKKKPERIILEFFGKTGEYLKTLPIHPSQKKLKESDDFLKVEIQVTPTYEFYSCLLGYGSEVKVISPKKVKNELLEMVKKIENRYFSS